MKNLVIILTFLLFLCGTCSDAAAGTTCNGIKVSPKINISTSFGQLSYNFNLNTRQITELDAQNAHRESSFFAAGLATISINSEYAIGTKARPSNGDQGYCVVPEAINIFVGYASPRIYVSNELEPNSCQYNLVLLHEQTHHRINIATLKYFLPIFESAAAKIAGDMKPVKISSTKQIDQATNEITKDFSRQFDKILSMYKKELAIEQGKLDNSINYSMENKLCRDFNSKKQWRFQGKSRQESR